ncbi:unnamed protein product [Victoria cruziana]
MIYVFESIHDGWGMVVLVGVPHKDVVFKTHPMNFLNERTLKRTFYENYKPHTNIPRVVELYMKNELELDKFCTHHVLFKDINKVFDLILSGQGIRFIICMED